MTRESIPIIALIIFSAIMVVLIWFIFTIGLGYFLEQTIPSQNGLTFITFSRKVTEGWGGGSIVRDFRLQQTSENDIFAIGVITKDGANAINSMGVCLREEQQNCIKLASKDKIKKCTGNTDLCICLFKLKFRHGFNSYGAGQNYYNLVHIAGQSSGDYATDFNKISLWNSIYFSNVLDKLQQFDVVLCENLNSSLRCKSSDGPCMLVAKYRDIDDPSIEYKDIITWIPANSLFERISMAREIKNGVPTYNLLLNFQPYPGIVWGEELYETW